MTPKRLLLPLAEQYGNLPAFDRLVTFQSDWNRFLLVHPLTNATWLLVTFHLHTYFADPNFVRWSSQKMRWFVFNQYLIDKFPSLSSNTTMVWDHLKWWTNNEEENILSWLLFLPFSDLTILNYVHSTFMISALTGDGVDELEEYLLDQVISIKGPPHLIWWVFLGSPFLRIVTFPDEMLMFWFWVVSLGCLKTLGRRSWFYPTADSQGYSTWDCSSTHIWLLA